MLTLGGFHFYSLLFMDGGGKWRGSGILLATLHWRHNGRDSVSNHQPHDCLLNCLFRRRSKKNTKAPRHWPLCGEFTGTGEFPAQMASNAENVSICWRHHEHCRHKQPCDCPSATVGNIGKLCTYPTGIILNMKLKSISNMYWHIMGQSLCRFPNK